jgi:hypothetical protein
MKSEDRVIVWNSYFCEARNFAIKLNDGDIPYCDLEGGILPFEKHYALMTMVHLALAIDARANHLLYKFEEEGKIDKNKREEIEHVTGEYRWKKLPTLIGKKKINLDKPPHSAIKKIYEVRNDFIHLHYEEFIKKIPDKNNTCQYFNDFVDAMEDMNVILGREEPGRQYVKKLKILCD